MKYLSSEGCSWRNDTFVVGWAAQSGNLELVSQHSDDILLRPIYIYQTANLRARTHSSFHCEQVQWLLQDEGAPLSADAMAGAARSGPLAICEYLLSRQCAMDANAFAAAARGHHFHILNWLYEHECPMQASACTAAVHGRHFDVLCWLYEHGRPGDTGTCHAAAWTNKLDTLRWLHEHACSWDASACKAAAQKGALDMLRYATCMRMGVPGTQWMFAVRVPALATFT
jgi:hypothetical protein